MPCRFRIEELCRTPLFQVAVGIDSQDPSNACRPDGAVAVDEAQPGKHRCAARSKNGADRLGMLLPPQRRMRRGVDAQVEARGIERLSSGEALVEPITRHTVARWN